MAKVLPLEGDIFAFIFEGDRGISGDTALVDGTIVNVKQCEAD